MAIQGGVVCVLVDARFPRYKAPSNVMLLLAHRLCMFHTHGEWQDDG